MVTVLYDYDMSWYDFTFLYWAVELNQWCCYLLQPGWDLYKGIYVCLLWLTEIC